jgi:hypothetical protein
MKMHSISDKMPAVLIPIETIEMQKINDKVVNRTELFCSHSSMTATTENVSTLMSVKLRHI